MSLHGASLMKNTKLLQNRDLLTEMMGSSTLPEIFSIELGESTEYTVLTHIGV